MALRNLYPYFGYFKIIYGLDVKELSEILTIGINYGGKVIKETEKKKEIS